MNKCSFQNHTTHSQFVFIISRLFPKPTKKSKNNFSMKTTVNTPAVYSVLTTRTTQQRTIFSHTLDLMDSLCVLSHASDKYCNWCMMDARRSWSTHEMQSRYNEYNHASHSYHASLNILSSEFESNGVIVENQGETESEGKSESSVSELLWRKRQQTTNGQRLKLKNKNKWHASIAE